MTPDEFAEDLRSQGYPEPILVEYPSGGLEEHHHPFEAKALILSGEITIITEGHATLLKPGDIFHLKLNQPHAERYGPTGVKYLVGRRR